jgi:hypothetical protein
MNDSLVPVSDPFDAPVWRKLLAVRVLLLCVGVAAFTAYLINSLDPLTKDLPKWIRTGGALLLASPFFACFLAIKDGLADLVIHFVPEGKVRRALFRGDERGSAAQVAARSKQSPLIVSCLATFMMRWLIPRLYAFNAAHPGTEVRLAASHGAGQVRG